MVKNKFERQGSSTYKRVKDSWRKPKGGDSKMRKGKKGHPKLVKIGRRKPKSERGLHPSGFREVLVHNPQELEGINPEKEAIKMASDVGKRKRKEIIGKAKEEGIKVLNERRDKSEFRNSEENGS
ncbi:hypothetical protein AKJ51_04660 [candidate division MSBL1 archaeon SCGC-AAA382A20]|uniref:Large ribosomal subunit protein eL32 n=1 Tax=candidate division MSBL1 archaeon SCGC-AAA382A20 TaxID=1698280 RepID=A0A133VHE3_9EURY|nr:hypothetical protein AKJ51_04660 [candidate division MSBL1 archaeon SCGC-AAA382A20]